MVKAKTDSEKILAALEDLHTRLEDLFILQACRAGIKQKEIRAILGIDIVRVTRIAKHVKEGK
jgi:DNA-directed RNA polymerase specialized sigma24 family protein